MKSLDGMRFIMVATSFVSSRFAPKSFVAMAGVDRRLCSVVVYIEQEQERSGVAPSVPDMALGLLDALPRNVIR